MKKLFKLYMIINATIQLIGFSTAEAQVNPWPWPDNPVEDSKTEIVVPLTVHFEIETCTKGEFTETCNKSLLLNSLKPITLKLIGCSNTDNNCNTIYKKGHWIDLIDNSFVVDERLIGVISVTKIERAATPQTPATSDFLLIAEVLGRNKTLAKLEGRFASWSQLQPVRLQVDESQHDGYRRTIFLNFGPPVQRVEPNSPSKELLPHIEWHVSKGRLTRE
jgi:hypothetical protein